MYNLYKDLSINCHIYSHTSKHQQLEAWAGACALSGFSGSGICGIWPLSLVGLVICEIQQVMTAAFRISSFPLQSFHKAKTPKAAKARAGGASEASCTPSGGQGWPRRTVSFWGIANGAGCRWMRQLCQLGVGMLLLHTLHRLCRLHRQILLCALTSLPKNSTSPPAPKSHWGWWPRAVLVDRNAGPRPCPLCMLCFRLCRARTTWRAWKVKSGTCTTHSQHQSHGRPTKAPRWSFIAGHFVASPILQRSWPSKTQVRSTIWHYVCWSCNK